MAHVARLASVAVLLFAVAAPPALAARGLPPDAPAAAEQRYQIGLGLYRQKRYAEAAREFRVAFELYPKSPKLAYNLGRCLERADKPQGAIEAYRTYLKLAPNAKDRTEVLGFVKALEDVVRKALPELVLSSDPEGAAVAIDGDAVSGKTPLRVRLAPGSHVVRFSLGDARETRTVEVAAGRQNAVHVELPVTVVTPAPSPPPAPDAPVSERGPTWMTWAGVGALALGVGGGVLGVLQLSAAQDSVDKSGELTGDDPERGQLEDDLQSQQALMWVGFGAGAALLATGATLIVLDLNGDETTALLPAPGGAALRVRF